jgi:hypothetical protein
MVYALHKFCHYLLSNKFIFYVDHMALLYLVRKSQVSRRLVRWLLLFLEYDFLIIYKPGRSQSMANSLPQIFDLIEENRIPDQTMDAPFFFLQPV